VLDGAILTIITIAGKRSSLRVSGLFFGNARNGLDIFFGYPQIAPVFENERFFFGLKTR
jgi:hypothetical protein